MKKLLTASAMATVIAIALGLGPANAADGNQGSHAGSHAGQGEIKDIPANTEAVVIGVVNSVDAAAGKINVTHEPVPELGWPRMTMDLPVTRRVDLSALKPGETVNFTLKQGLDKQFRVIAIEPKQ